MEATKRSLLTWWSHHCVDLLKRELSFQAFSCFDTSDNPNQRKHHLHGTTSCTKSTNFQEHQRSHQKNKTGGGAGTTLPREWVQWCLRQPENDDSPSGREKIVRCHLQALGIPRYSFWHGLQTQTLAVHMRAGTAALVRTSTGRGSAQQQQQHRSNQSQEPARRTTLPRPGRKHHIHWNYSPKARFRVKICWGSLCGS